MKTVLRFGLGAVIFLMASTAVAQERVAWSGSVTSSVGMKLWTCESGTCPLTNYNNRNTLKLQLDANITERVAAVAAIDVRNINEAQITTVEDSSSVQNVQPVTFLVQSAYVDAYDMLPGLDLRVGAQRIKWGTADGFSPTDRINAFDLQDPIYFDKRLAAVAATGAYHFDDFVFTASWIPFFTPALLAPEIVDVATSEEARSTIEVDIGSQEPPDIRELRTRIELPAATLENMQYAARLQWRAPIADLSVGYFYGRDSLPNLSGEIVPETFFSREELDIIANLRYPKLQMIAADARAPLFADISGWIDFGLMIPASTKVFISEERLEALVRLGIIDSVDGPVETQVQTGEVYPNFAVGFDRSFGQWIYVNVQYLYGFLFERNPGDLHHYGLMNLRIPALDNWWEIDLRGGIEANPDFDAFGWLASGRVTTRFDDVFRVSLLGMVQNGQKGTTLRLFRQISEVRLEAGVDF